VKRIPSVLLEKSTGILPVAVKRIPSAFQLEIPPVAVKRIPSAFQLENLPVAVKRIPSLMSGITCDESKT
jgi:hypothetical protein